MERLWAPWRLSYIKGEAPDGCIFCAKVDEPDEQALIIRRGETCFAMLNLYPYGNGHVMISPYRHLARPGDLAAAERAELWQLLDETMIALETAFGAQGHNAGLNLGAAAGAGIKDHLHLHVVPRWAGDTNYMPVLADVRVMPQHLAETRAALAAAWPIR